MQIATSFFLGVFAVLLLLFIGYSKTGQLFKCAAFTAYTGLGALGCLWLIGHWVALPLTLTPFTILLAGGLGIPGILWMLVFPLL